MFEDLFAYDVDELDTAAVLTAAAECHALHQRLEVLGLLHALRIADLHHEPHPGSAGPGRERRRVYGGAGCPAIAEFAPIEFGAVMGMSPAAAKAYMSDAVELRHRLPFTFARVLAGDADAWKARKIARATQPHPEPVAALVDQRVAAIINSVTPVRLATIVDAALWEADPAAAKAAAEEHARTRGVWVRRSDDHGTKSFYVRAATGDVIRFDATIDDIAQALRALGDTDTLDQRRAKAIGIIADPALAHELLEIAHHLAKTHTTNTTGDTTDTGGNSGGTGNGGNTGASDTTGNSGSSGGGVNSGGGNNAAQHRSHGKGDGAANGSDGNHDHDGAANGSDGNHDHDSDSRHGGRDRNDSHDGHGGDDGDDGDDGVAGTCGDDHGGAHMPGCDGPEGSACDGASDGVASSNGSGSGDGNGSGDGAPGRGRNVHRSQGSQGKDDGAIGGCGDDRNGDHMPGRGHDACGQEASASDGDDSDHCSDAGSGIGSGGGCGAGAVADDWYPANEPGPDDEADRDAPHPSNSDLADPLDTPARILAEPWRDDEDQNGQNGPGEGGPAMDVFSRRALAGKLAEIKQAAYATGLGAGSRRGPRQVIAYVHLTDKTLATGQGVLRVEQYGPMVASQFSELLGHDQIVVKPVIDLNDRVSVDAYEIPDRIRERVKLIHPVEQFVYGTAETTMRTDLDHTVAYDPTGPPGQTSTTNLAPLGRFSHRVKTYGDWPVRRLDDGAYEWVSPHGFKFRVDHTGTHPLGTEPLDTDPTDDDTA
jgi:uncharacterized membrane protein YgcG